MKLHTEYSWAGLFNTQFWIDQRRHAAAVMMMQMLPFLRRTVSLNLMARFPARSATAYFLTAVLVASCSGVPVKSEQITEIRLSASLNTCFIADVEVPCSEVGAKLLAMNVPLNSRIHCVGDSVVSYELVHATLESLDRAGYSTKVGFLTD